MSRIKFTLLADGPTDKALIPILKWLLIQREGSLLFESEWADLSRMRPQPRGLSQRILAATILYPCDILFIHRDAENQPHTLRYGEIDDAISEAWHQNNSIQYVCVVPVRMQETWLLFDACAIRKAAGNPYGTSRLDLPPLSRLEGVTGAKTILYGLLRTASELTGRHLERFNPKKCACHVTHHINDYSPLLCLPAFGRLQRDINNLALPA
jgi:hypothetical protein